MQQTKLPSNVDWRGPTALLVRLLEICEANCPSTYHGSCGVSANCKVCEIVQSQRTLDHLLELWMRAPQLVEWDEPLLRFRWIIPDEGIIVEGVDGVPERGVR